MCATGKVEFTSAKAARTALNRAKRSRRERRHERSFYRCPICRSFHLTSNEPEKGKRFT
jgi:hypothetical protein